MEIFAIILFVLILVFLLLGYPVAITLGGMSIIFGLIFVPDFLDLLPLRIMGIMENSVLMAVPLFIFMGLMLEKSGLAERLLEAMAMLFGKINGGLAISVVVVGALLAASTGIVGATVVTMGLISLPVMLKRNYSPELATGVIASSGTLGQIIPPSIVLVLLGSVMNVSVGGLFKAAFIPGFIIVLVYIIYILVVSQVKPGFAPAIPEEEVAAFRQDNYISKLIKAFVLPLTLIVIVLGSIFLGVASPTEAAAVGALGSIMLTWAQGQYSWEIMKKVSEKTSHLTSMVFLILLGATTFSLVFRGLGGDKFLVEVIEQSNLGKYTFLFLVMLVIFIAGFFIDFIEIVFIIIPVVTPLFAAYDFDLIWVGILIALNLQTSFLSPPFGFALFYLKGVAPPQITTGILYRGVIPFLVLQLLVVLLVFFFPNILLK
jgi:tripartite ATP-independent transporter DctM subunit